MRNAHNFIQDYTPVFHAKAYTIRHFIQVRTALCEFFAKQAELCGVKRSEFVCTPEGCVDEFGKKLLSEEKRKMKETAIRDRQAFLDLLVKHQPILQAFWTDLQEACMRSHNGAKLTTIYWLQNEEQQSPNIREEIRRFPIESPCRTKELAYYGHVRVVLKQVSDILSEVHLLRI